MPGVKRLRSVAHCIAHHSLSALSYVHPHLADWCHSRAVPFVELDPLVADPLAAIADAPAPLLNAARSFQELSRTILASEGFRLNEIRSAVARFHFTPGSRWTGSCYVMLETVAGAAAEVTIGDDGRKIAAPPANYRLERR